MLDIKEIFKSDLDPNLTIWWSNAKVDKLNYNFNQLVLGGPQGPQGQTGNSGAYGARGDQGFQGPVGYDGPQGYQGPEAISAWTRRSTADRDIVIPKDNFENQQTAIRVVFSDFITNVVDVDGDGQGDFAYSINAPILLNDGVLINYVHDISKNNIEFKATVNDPADPFNFNIFQQVVNRAFINLESPLNDEVYITAEGRMTLEQTKLTAINIDKYFELDTNLFNVVSNLVISGDVDVAGSFKYKNNAATGKVLAADNNTGDVSWRLKHEVIGTFPVGSIVSIPVVHFNDTNFYLDETLSSTESNQDSLKIRFGAGKTGSPYEGWYLCNGQTWTDSNGVLQFELPNLNNFEYQIDDNGNGQPLSSGGDDTIIIVGGIDLVNDAEYIGSGQYSVMQDVDYTDLNITLDYNQGSDFYKTGNVHVAFLNQKDLTWTDVNGGTPPVVTENIILGFDSSNSSTSCAAPTQTYLWTGIGKTWSNTSEDLTGVVLYTAGNQIAPTGWYTKDGLARYWNGSNIEFTIYSPCPVQQTITLAYNLYTNALNGTMTGGQTYTIDNASFKFATSLQSNGINANAGWYREINNANGARRYWDGAQFVGEVITQTHIVYIGDVDYSYGTSYDICANHEGPFETYIGINTTFQSSGGSDLEDIYQNGGIVYVHTDWLGTTVNALPLTKVRSQNGDGGYQPYNGMFDVDAMRAAIQSNSKIYLPQPCGGN